MGTSTENNNRRARNNMGASRALANLDGDTVHGDSASAAEDPKAPGIRVPSDRRERGADQRKRNNVTKINASCCALAGQRVLAGRGVFFEELI